MITGRRAAGGLGEQTSVLPRFHLLHSGLIPQLWDLLRKEKSRYYLIVERHVGCADLGPGSGLQLLVSYTEQGV